MNKKTLCASAFALALVVPLSAQAEPIDGATAARSWLNLLDQSSAGACWATPSATKEDGVSAVHSLAVVKAFRGRFGELVERAVAAEENSKSVPGMPDGNYKILSFNSVFTHKSDVTEAVILSKVAGDWQVSGYCIR